ncbi:MAG: C39 family peptidase [Bryobacterales bacterium]|nr:C39 family peptidase [Bryobacterales bacterium]
MWPLPLLAALTLASAAGEVRLPVPYVAQEKNGCGAAVLAMVMRYWGAAGVDAAAMHRDLYVPAAHGVYASAMQAYLQTHGFRAFAFSGGWDDLRQHLGKGRPLIVALKTRGGALHYVVLAGVSDDGVLRQDPAVPGYGKQSRREFESEWKGTGNWTLLALPSSSAAAP